MGGWQWILALHQWRFHLNTSSFDYGTTPSCTYPIYADGSIHFALGCRNHTKQRKTALCFAQDWQQQCPGMAFSMGGFHGLHGALSFVHAWRLVPLWIYICHPADWHYNAVNQWYWLQFHNPDNITSRHSLGNIHLVCLLETSESYSSWHKLLPFGKWLNISHLDTYIHRPFEFATICSRKTCDLTSQGDWDALSKHQSMFRNPLSWFDVPKYIQFTLTAGLMWPFTIMPFGTPLFSRTHKHPTLRQFHVTFDKRSLVHRSSFSPLHFFLTWAVCPLTFVRGCCVALRSHLAFLCLVCVSPLLSAGLSWACHPFLGRLRDGVPISLLTRHWRQGCCTSRSSCLLSRV